LIVFVSPFGNLWLHILKSQDGSWYSTVFNSFSYNLFTFLTGVMEVCYHILIFSVVNCSQNYIRLPFARCDTNIRNTSPQAYQGPSIIWHFRNAQHLVLHNFHVGVVLDLKIKLPKWFFRFQGSSCSSVVWFYACLVLWVKWISPPLASLFQAKSPVHAVLAVSCFQYGCIAPASTCIFRVGSRHVVRTLKQRVEHFCLHTGTPVYASMLFSRKIRIHKTLSHDLSARHYRIW
jgi:hypothetical protein